MTLRGESINFALKIIFFMAIVKFRHYYLEIVIFNVASVKFKELCHNMVGMSL